MAHRAFFRSARSLARSLALLLFAGRHVLIAVAVLPLGLAASAPAWPEPAPARPAAKRADVEGSGERAKLIFTLSAPVEANGFVLAEPDRAVIDLPQTDFDLDPEAGRSSPRQKGGLIASFRFGQLEPGKSRIVIDLASPARIVRTECDTSETDGNTRLVIELAKTEASAFRMAVQAARAQLTASAQAKNLQRPALSSAKPVVVLDPGHGGIDRGAMIKGLVEKELALEFAKAVADKLAAGGHFNVILTRQDDRFVSLSERVRTARESNAALFVSIHADTISEASDVSGATVYTLSDRASDAEAARVAEKENQSDAAAGLDSAEQGAEISEILFDLTRRETRAYSHLFAHSLINYWRSAGRLNKNPRRSAGFKVLKAPDVPSVLLELGYLSNRSDHDALRSLEWREKASRQVAAAIEAYFSARDANQSMSKARPALSPLGSLGCAQP